MGVCCKRHAQLEDDQELYHFKNKNDTTSSYRYEHQIQLHTTKKPLVFTKHVETQSKNGAINYEPTKNRPNNALRETERPNENSNDTRKSHNIGKPIRGILKSTKKN